MTEAQVVEVVDGDTIKVNIGGQIYTVRYIGIDAPEKASEELGPAATTANANLLKDKRVRLEKDVSETDDFGRLLRYVWVGDKMVNADLVSLGYARAVAYPPDVKYRDLLAQAQREAQEAGRGLWEVATEASPAATNCTAAKEANLRAGPGTNYQVVGKVAAGQVLDVVACNPDRTWYQLAGGQWIFAQLISNPPAVPVAAEIPALPPAAAPTAPNAFTCTDGCAQPPDPSCNIKGNVNLTTGTRIYHTTASRWYDNTDIKPEEGDRWFCTIQEAEAAGFRAPKD